MSPQIVLNGLVNAALIAPPAVAFTMMLGVLRFTNFAVGAYVTVGAFAAYFANVQLGQPLLAAAIFAMAATAVVAWLTHLVVFRPLEGHDPVALLVVSIALAFVLEQCIRLIYGGGVRGFDLPLERPVRAFGLRITYEQMFIIALSTVAATGVHVLLNHTPLGLAMRATADNPTLAENRGIRRHRVVAATWLGCGALLGLSGVLAGLDLVVEPLIGWNLTIPVIAAAILGGVGSPAGALLGAVLVGVAEELTVLVLPTTYKVGVGFVIIALLLLFRPHGLLGQPEIKK